MRSLSIKIITCIAMVAIFFLQGIWLYNTYTLLDKELKDNLEEVFARSIEKEIYFRYDSADSQITRDNAVEGARPDNDFYANALAFHEFLLTYDVAFSLEDMDSIWQQKLADDIGVIRYSLFITDSTDNVIQRINQGIADETRFSLHLKRPLRKDHSEYIQVIVESPHKVVLDRTLLVLIASLIIAIVVGYCFYLQIRIIMRQNRIAEIRQDFTHAMVHDMKNPITTILMSTNALKGGKLDDKEELKKQYHDMILKEGDHLLSLANRILTIARFEEHQIALSKEDVEVTDLFNKLTDRHRLSSTKAVEFTTAFNDVSILYADPEYIEEVFNNLIDNAIKYSKECVMIRITCQKEKHTTLIKIRDNGIGISLKDRKHIFDTFERGHTRKEKKSEGFGLGLSYVYHVIKAHGGDVQVESVLDQYSEFTVSIPNRK